MEHTEHTGRLRRSLQSRQSRHLAVLVTVLVRVVLATVRDAWRTGLRCWCSDVTRVWWGVGAVGTGAKVVHSAHRVSAWQWARAVCVHACVCRVVASALSVHVHATPVKQ